MGKKGGLDLGAIFATAYLETQDFTNDLDDLTRRLDRFLEVGNQVASGINQAFATFIQTGFEAANMTDLNTRAFTNLAGSVNAAQDFVRRLREFAVGTPFEFEGLADTTKTLQAMGVELDNTIPLLQIFGDKAASANLGADAVKRIAIAFTQVQAMGKLGGQEFIQFTNNGINLMGILTKQYGVSAAEIRKMMEAGMLDSKTVLSAILRDMVSTSQGQMAELNNTFSGRMSSIKEAFLFQSGDLMKPLYDKVTEMLPLIAEFGTTLLNAMALALPYFMQGLDLFGAILLYFVNLDDATQNWIIGLTAAGAAFIVLTSTVLTGIFTVAAALAVAFTIIDILGGPVAAIFIAIGLQLLTLAAIASVYFVEIVAAAAVIYTIYDVFKRTIEPIMELFALLGEFIGTVFTDILDIVTMPGELILSAFSTIFATILEMGTDLKDRFILVFNILSDTAVQFAEGFFKAWAAFGINMEGLANGIVQVWATVFDAIKMYAWTAYDVLASTADEFSQGVVKAGKAVVFTIADQSTKLVSFLYDMTDGYRTWVLDIFTSIVNWFSAGATEALSMLQPLISLYDQIVNKGEEIYTKATTDTIARIQEVTAKGIQSLKDLADTIKIPEFKLPESFTNGKALAPVDVEKLISDLFGNMTITVPTNAGRDTQDKFKLGANPNDIIEAMAQSTPAYISFAAQMLMVSNSLKRMHDVVDKVANDMQQPVDELTDIWKSWADAMEQAIKDQKRNSVEMLQKMLGSDLTGLGSAFKQGSDMTGFAGAFAGLSPVLGGLIGVLVELVTKTKAYARIQETVSHAINGVVRLLDAALTAIAPLMDVLDRVITIIVRGLKPVFTALGAALDPIVAAIQPVIGIVQALMPIISTFGQIMAMFNPVVMQLKMVMQMLYYPLLGLAIVVTLFALAIGTVWNAIVKAITSILVAINKITGGMFGKAFRNIISDLENTMVNTDKLKNNLHKMLTDSSWEHAQAQAEDTKNIKDNAEAVKEMTEKLTNIPEGYKLALATFNATQGDSSRHGKPGNGRIPAMARGGIVTRPTIALIGEAGPEAVIPLSDGGPGGNTTIIIEVCNVMANNIEELANEISRIAGKQAFMRGGNVNPNKTRWKVR